MVNKRVRNAVLRINLKTNRMISAHFQGKPFNITVIQVYAPTSNGEKSEVERFYEDLQDLSELTCKKDVLFIIGDWNAKVGSQEIPGVTCKFGLGIQNEAGQRLIGFCQENTLVISRVTIYSLEILLFLYGTSLLFHVRTGTYLTHPCPALCNRPSSCKPANPLNHARPCIKTL